MATLLDLDSKRTPSRSVKPSIPNEVDSNPFSCEQELTPFGKWVSPSVWVPPKDMSKEMANSMLNKFGAFASKERCWNAMVSEFRSKFTEVREIELNKASIRLPQGRLLVSVTRQEHFDQITDEVPNCVRTRLDEFLDGPGKKMGVKVYYLKPLCVEVDNKLIFTSNEAVQAAIKTIQDEVFSEYRRRYCFYRPTLHVLKTADLALTVPRKMLKHHLERKKRLIDTHQAKLELTRRKSVLKAARIRKRYRSDDCSYESILALTKPVQRGCAVQQYALERQYSKEKALRLMRAGAATLPWFVAMGVTAGVVGYVANIVMLTSAAVAGVASCDPAFVAEMPGSEGVVLKIGHFDEVDGVMHVEI